MGSRFSARVQTGCEAHPASRKMGTGSVPGIERPGRGVDHPTPSSAEVKERVELYLFPLRAFVVCSRVNYTIVYLFMSFPLDSAGQLVDASGPQWARGFHIGPQIFKQLVRYSTIKIPRYRNKNNNYLFAPKPKYKGNQNYFTQSGTTGVLISP